MERPLFDSDTTDQQWAQAESDERRYMEDALLSADPGYAIWAKKQDHDDLQFKLKQETDMEINDNMTFSELVPTKSDFLKKEDVGEGGLIVTIKGFTRETLKSDSGADEEKTVMHFVEELKPMVLNATNAQLIPVCTGAQTAGQAKGKKIIVYNDPTVSFGGKITGGLRIRKAVADQPVAAAPGEPDDDIPF